MLYNVLRFAMVNLTYNSLPVFLVVYLTSTIAFQWKAFHLHNKVEDKRLEIFRAIIKTTLNSSLKFNEPIYF